MPTSANTVKTVADLAVAEYIKEYDLSQSPLPDVLRRVLMRLTLRRTG